MRGEVGLTKNNSINTFVLSEYNLSHKNIGPNRRFFIIYFWIIDSEAVAAKWVPIESEKFILSTPCHNDGLHDLLTVS